MRAQKCPNSRVWASFREFRLAPESGAPTLSGHMAAPDVDVHYVAHLARLGLGRGQFLPGPGIDAHRVFAQPGMHGEVLVPVVLRAFHDRQRQTASAAGMPVACHGRDRQINLESPQ